MVFLNFVGLGNRLQMRAMMITKTRTTLEIPAADSSDSNGSTSGKPMALPAIPGVPMAPAWDSVTGMTERKINRFGE